MTVINRSIGNYFGAAFDRPYHLSVGVVVLDANNEVYCLHYPQIQELQNVYVLPTKTLRPNESLEVAAARCAKTEVGCEIQVITFLGATDTADEWWRELGTPAQMRKTVLFFLAKAMSHNPEDAKEELDKEKCLLEVQPFDFLIEKMSSQQVKNGMRDWNHTELVRRAQKWLKTHPDLKSPTLP